MEKFIKIVGEYAIYTKKQRIFKRRLTKDAQLVLSYYNKIPANLR